MVTTNQCTLPDVHLNVAAGQCACCPIGRGSNGNHGGADIEAGLKLKRAFRSRSEGLLLRSAGHRIEKLSANDEDDECACDCEQPSTPAGIRREIDAASFNRAERDWVNDQPSFDARVYARQSSNFENKGLNRSGHPGHGCIRISPADNSSDATVPSGDKGAVDCRGCSSLCR